MKRKLLIIPVLILVLVGVSACGNFQKNSYRGLGTMAVSYDIAMKSAADLRGKGLISDEGLSEIIRVAGDYSGAHNAAVQAFQDYLMAPEADKATKQDIARTAMSASLGLYSELLAILMKYQVQGEPVEPWF